MSTDYSADRAVRRPRQPDLGAGHKLSMQNVEAYNRNQQILGQSLQNGMAVSPNELRAQAGFHQSVSPVSQQSYNSGMDMTPVLQTSAEQDNRRRRRSSAKLNPGPGASSHVDALMRENAQLRQEIEELRAASEEKENAVEHMLDDVMKSEELLEENKKALSAKDAELASLRSEVVRLTSEARNGPPESLIPGKGRAPANDGEIRNLQLRCSRLKIEAERKDAQLREAQEQLRSHSISQSRSPALDTSDREMQDLRSQLTQLTREAQENRQQADAYYQQIHDWKNAYDELQQSKDELHQSFSQKLQAAQARENLPKVDEQAAKSMEAHHANELRNAMEVSDFYKNNSTEVAKKNKAIVAENMALQKSLHEKTRELDQQRSLIRTLQT